MPFLAKSFLCRHLPLNDTTELIPDTELRAQAWKVLLTHQRKPHFHRAHPLHDHQDYNHGRSLPEETPHAAPVREGGAPTFLDNCDYRMILKVQPISDESLTRQYLSDVEAELTDPTGAFAGKPLRIPTRGLAFSSACGWSLELLADGIRTPQFFDKAHRYAFLVTASTLLQLQIFLHQMRHNSDQMSNGKVAVWTVALQAIMDSYLCLLHLTSGIVYGLSDYGTSLGMDPEMTLQNRCLMPSRSPPL